MLNLYLKSPRRYLTQDTVPIPINSDVEQEKNNFLLDRYEALDRECGLGSLSLTLKQ